MEYESFLFFNHFSSYIKLSIDKKIEEFQRIHRKKLTRLGLNDPDNDNDADKFIFNFSDRILTKREKVVLAHGLKFGLPPRKLNYSKFFLSFEKLFATIKKEEIYRPKICA